jgi:hypothetical protein
MHQLDMLICRQDEAARNSKQQTAGSRQVVVRQQEAQGASEAG